VLVKTLRLDGYSYTIAGVMPASFLFPERDVDVWSPIPPDAPYAQNRNSTWYTVIGRLKPGFTPVLASGNLAAVQAQLGREYPKPDADLAVSITPLKELTVASSRESLWLLFGSVSLLLLIACTNIVALLLARSAQRQHEISVRFSLGASRFAILMQLLAESFVLALCGALLGLFLAWTASGAFRALGSGLPRADEMHFDARIAIYALSCSVVVTLLCGLLPALRSTRGGLSRSLSHTGRTQVFSRARLQWMLVGVQVALAVTLLSGAGLLYRSLRELGRVSPGFDASHVLTFHVSASWGESEQMQKLEQRIDRTMEALRSLPGVDSVATSAVLPGVPSQYQTELQFAERETDPEHKMVAESRFISPSYFEAMKIPLLSGESCLAPKFNSAAHVVGQPDTEFGSVYVVVNRSFANTYLHGSTALGRHLRLVGQLLHEGEIRGVVGDAREEGLSHTPGPTVYWCMSAPVPDPFYLVCTRTEPMALAETIRQRIKEIEPGRSVYNLSPLEEHLSDAFAENRLRTILLSFFAGTAVLLACVGLYGTLSYSVNTRRREIGLRLALGAMREQIVGQFLLQGLGVTFLGCLAGSVLAALFARVLSGMLYGVSPWDVATLLSVVLIVLAVSAWASLLPSVRAARVDPMEVLREE
jgi:predicted permease